MTGVDSVISARASEPQGAASWPVGDGTAFPLTRASIAGQEFVVFDRPPRTLPEVLRASRDFGERPCSTSATWPPAWTCDDGPSCRFV